MSASAKIIRQWFHRVTLSTTVALLTACGGGGGDNNQAPTATDDSGVTNADIVLNIPVLDNDTDPDTSDSLNVTAAGPASAQGAVVTVNAGDIRYDPTGVAAFIALAAGEPLLDTFSYTINDGNGGTDTATVSVTVTGVNDAPTATDDSGLTNANVVLNIPVSSVLFNDTDPDTSDSLSVTAAGPASAQGAVVTVNAGDIRYDPTGVAAFIALAAGEPLLDTFSYTVSDGDGGTDTATVSVTVTGVNDAPAAADDLGATTNADVVLTIPASSVLFNDTDPDTSDSLSVTAANPASAQGAAVTVNAGNIRYDPTGVTAFIALAAGQTLPGPDTFSYTVSDGNGGTDTATVSVTVTGVNDAPAATDDSGATNADVILNIPASSVLVNDTDPDTNDSLNVTAADPVSAQGAAVTLNAGNISYDPTGVTAFIALATGDTLSDSFSYTVSDGNGGTDTATVGITVTGVNDPPAALATCSTMRRETPLNGTLGADDPDTSDLLTYSVETQGSKGTVTITNSTTGEYTYTPNNGVWGTDSFTYKVEDLEGAFDIGTETVIIDPRIMPLGDSITRGAFGDGNPIDEHKIGYRKPLYDGLLAAGYSFDFVGTVTTDGTNSSYAPFDVDSEGHGGWWAFQIAYGHSTYPSVGNITDWLNATSPDIILLHIGTNGLPNLTAYDNAADVGAILDEIDAWEIANSDSITVILARIIDQDPLNPDIAAFNAELDAMVAGRTGDDIIVVDMQNVLTPGPADYADEVHPTNDGYAKMAPVWQTALTVQANNILYNNKCP